MTPRQIDGAETFGVMELAEMPANFAYFAL
jgi:hypothetical protein